MSRVKPIPVSRIPYDEHRVYVIGEGVLNRISFHIHKSVNEDIGSHRLREGGIHIAHAIISLDTDVRVSMLDTNGYEIWAKTIQSFLLTVLILPLLRRNLWMMKRESRCHRGLISSGRESLPLKRGARKQKAL
jgi:hypothetical protein